MVGAKELPRGASIRVRLGEIDFIALELTGSLVARLDVDERDPNAKPAMDESDDEDVSLGTVAIAMDVNEDNTDHVATP